jgi:hypothetical protein
LSFVYLVYRFFIRARRNEGEALTSP